MSASKSHLKAVDSVHNTGLRICLGAFRSSPAQNILNQNQFHKVLYTDASKNDVGVGSAVVSSLSTTKLIKLPAVCSVYTAELYGIVEAFRMLEPTGRNVAICTDSLSSIQVIKNVFSDHPLVNLIHDIYNKLTDHGVIVTSVWVPSHVGAVENDAADVAAKEASNWNTTPSHLHDIQPVIPSLELPPMPRRYKVILRRLRLGHTRLTHGFLMASTNPPSCGHCSSLLTVRHFLIECPHLSAKRKPHQLGDNIKEMLSETQKFVNLFKYLKDTQVLSKLKVY
ncbi:uncharacterized protein [Diabrotica undecimpunctata]|uniref:uncharacterized protein n=1 Tax=Diabrotica undecimpunctata TaxID=50387 RepID=UPI003B6392BA